MAVLVAGWTRDAELHCHEGEGTSAMVGRRKWDQVLVIQLQSHVPVVENPDGHVDYDAGVFLLPALVHDIILAEIAMEDLSRLPGSMVTY